MATTSYPTAKRQQNRRRLGVCHALLSPSQPPPPPSSSSRPLERRNAFRKSSAAPPLPVDGPCPSSAAPPTRRHRHGTGQRPRLLSLALSIASAPAVLLSLDLQSPRRPAPPAGDGEPAARARRLTYPIVPRVRYGARKRSTGKRASLCAENHCNNAVK